jgi:hypothetical protein
MLYTCFLLKEVSVFPNLKIIPNVIYIIYSTLFLNNAVDLPLIRVDVLEIGQRFHVMNPAHCTI